MNLVELALRKLRLSGMADVLETRLQQAQVEQTLGCPRFHVATSPGVLGGGFGSTHAVASPLPSTLRLPG